jgi:hypothetical protein
MKEYAAEERGEKRELESFNPSASNVPEKLHHIKHEDLSPEEKKMLLDVNDSIRFIRNTEVKGSVGENEAVRKLAKHIGWLPNIIMSRLRESGRQAAHYKKIHNLG